MFSQCSRVNICNFLHQLWGRHGFSRKYERQLFEIILVKVRIFFGGGESLQNNFFIRFIFENFKLQLTDSIPDETTVYKQSYLKNTVMLFIHLFFFFFCIIGCMDFCKHVCVLSREDRKHLAHGYHMGLLSKYSKLYTQRKNKHLFFSFFFFFSNTQITLEGKICFFTCQVNVAEVGGKPAIMLICRTCVKTKVAVTDCRRRLSWLRSLICIQGCSYLATKAHTSLCLIFISIKRVPKPRFTFLSYSRGAFSFTRSLSRSPSTPPPFSPSSFSFFFISFSLPSLSLVRSFQCHSTRRAFIAGGRRLLSPASLLRFGCSCWAVIKRVKKRSFHTNYHTIMKCSAKGTVEMKVTLALILSE